MSLKISDFTENLDLPEDNRENPYKDFSDMDLYTKFLMYPGRSRNISIEEADIALLEELAHRWFDTLPWEKRHDLSHVVQQKTCKEKSSSF